MAMDAYIVPEIDRAALALRRRYDRLEIIHIPLHVFRVEFPDGRGGARDAAAGVDGLVGEFAFLNKTGLRLSDKPAGEYFPPVIDERTAQDLVTDNFRWRRIQMGLKNRRSHHPGRIVYEDVRYYPFWVGYFQRRGRARFHCWDAVSGKRGGIKTRRVLMVAFLNCHRRKAGLEADHG